MLVLCPTTVLTPFLFQIWENYVEGQEIANASGTENSRQKEVLQVLDHMHYDSLSVHMSLLS